MRTAIRDSGLFHPGHAPADWLLIPGDSFGPERDYLYAGDRLALQLDWTAEGPVRRYIAVDHLNSTRAIIDDSGNVEQVDFYPFGGFLTGNPVPDTTHLFTGHERDTAEFASNLDYMHARYFSPNLGRFLSVDPVGGEVGSSQSWNRYTYVLNNPIGTVDPDGREVRPVVVIGTGGKPVLTYVDVRMVPRLNALNLDAHRAGVSFTYNNVFRTREQQDAIVTPNTRNTTGTSPHLAGLAVDINVWTSLKGTDLAGLTEIAASAGLYPLADQQADPPHFQATDLITREQNGSLAQEYLDTIDENQVDAAIKESMRKTVLGSCGEGEVCVADALVLDAQLETAGSPR